MVDSIGTIQGIFKWEGQEYVVLDSIKKTVFDRTRNIFYAINFAPGFKKIESGKDVADSVIIDIVYDDGMPSKTLVKDPQKINSGIVMPFVTDYPGEVVWLGWFTVPGYTKYSSPGKHTVTVKVAPRKLAQWARGRDFSAEAGGIVAMMPYTIVDDRPQTPSGE
jgi:hypothetical protein